ncbi:MAG TPA: hypothetical protein VFH00_01495 [Candidatus Nitrosotalea sp.]|nr:hypothetical protein [Candidatus Nitrosotalea sp.]
MATTSAAQIERDRDFGFAAATLIGGGFGVAFFGVLTFVSERWVTTQAGLTLTKEVGPLSGKSVYGVIGWLVAWAVLAVILRRVKVSEKFTYWTTGILVAVGFLLTFPPVWKLLGA